MPYVMVPVPEDLVTDVMQLIIRLETRAAMEEWDQKSITDFFAELDEDGKAFLSAVARASVAGRDLSLGDIATLIELKARETAGIHRDVTELAAARNRPPLITQRDVTEVLPNGRTQERRAMTMEVEFATLVQQAERDDLLADGATGA